MQESAKRINMILTPEQRRIYAQVEQEMRAQMKARRAQGSVPHKLDWEPKFAAA